MENRVRVSIYGGTYSIQGDAAPEYIERLARLVNERMEEVGRSLSSGTPFISLLDEGLIGDIFSGIEGPRPGPPLS